MKILVVEPLKVPYEKEIDFIVINNNGNAYLRGMSYSLWQRKRYS